MSSVQSCQLSIAQLSAAAAASSQHRAAIQQHMCCHCSNISRLLNCWDRTLYSDLFAAAETVAGFAKLLEQAYASNLYLGMPQPSASSSFGAMSQFSVWQAMECSRVRAATTCIELPCFVFGSWLVHYLLN